MDKNKIIQDIQEAFKGVSREGGESLHETRVIYNGGSGEERVKARAKDLDKKWESIPARDIEIHSSALCYMNPISFRYHIPAFMIWILKNYEQSNSFTVDSTIYVLFIEQRMWESIKERFTILSKQQSAAIAHFLKYLIDNDKDRIDDVHAQLALDAYWNQFL